MDFWIVLTVCFVVGVIGGVVVWAVNTIRDKNEEVISAIKKLEEEIGFNLSFEQFVEAFEDSQRKLLIDIQKWPDIDSDKAQQKFDEAASATIAMAKAGCITVANDFITSVNKALGDTQDKLVRCIARNDSVSEELARKAIAKLVKEQEYALSWIKKQSDTAR